MKHCLQFIFVFILLIFGASENLFAHRNTEVQQNIENQISDSLTAITNIYTYVGKINVVGFSAKNNILTICISTI